MSLRSLLVPSLLLPVALSCGDPCAKGDGAGCAPAGTEAEVDDEDDEDEGGGGSGGEPDALVRATCRALCAQLSECGASPPSIVGALSGDSSPDDCRAHCEAPNSAMYGYADCQVDCLLEASCPTMDACWDATSDPFEAACGGRSSPVAPDETTAENIENGTVTGSALADLLVDNPAIAVAVDGAGFVIHYGDRPPAPTALIEVAGAIDESSNARPAGSAITTELCLHNFASAPAGATIDLCEGGIPGIAETPITGQGEDFTLYVHYPGYATILFSGSVNEEGLFPENVEALVVYLYSIDVWEHSFTSWRSIGDCDAGSCIP